MRLLIVFLIVSTSAWAEPRGLRATLGDIVESMSANAGRGSEAFQVPPAAARDGFAQAVLAALEGKTEPALPAPYRVVTLGAPGTGTVRVAAELDPRGMPAPVHFWGTYVMRVGPRAGARNLAVEVPHPLFDQNTWREGLELFLQGQARWLLIAGAHRCADSAASPCSGRTRACGGGNSPFRVSDAAHSVATPFAAVHERLSRNEPALTFLQLHGNAQRECPDALISDGAESWNPRGLAAKLSTALAKHGIARGNCGEGFPTSGCNLCARDNVEVRTTGGSVNACTEAAQSFGRVIHLEQHANVRETPSPERSGFQPVIDAALEAFPLN